jgi:hypothetical protein
LTAVDAVRHCVLRREVAELSSRVRMEGAGSSEMSFFYLEDGGRNFSETLASVKPTTRQQMTPSAKLS